MGLIEDRVAKDGTISYRAKVRLKGHPTETATFKRKTDARKWIADTESAIREGRHFKTSIAKRKTVSDAIDRYIFEILPRKPKSADKQKSQLLWWKKHMGDFSLADTKASTISEYRSILMREPSPSGNKLRSAATVNRYMAALSHMMTIAHKEWEWIDQNPCSKLSKLKEPRGRVRFLKDEEREKLLQECRNSTSLHLYPIVVLALSTGARLSEITSLSWDQVDLDNGRIVLHDTKNNERRVLYLASHAINILKEWAENKRTDTNLLFPNSKHPDMSIDIRTPWNTVVKNAGLKDFRFHDLRHSAASYLAMNGASPSEIAEILGHKSLQMVKRYAHLSDTHTRGVVLSMNEGIFGNESG
jgi:integrase